MSAKGWVSFLRNLILALLAEDMFTDEECRGLFAAKIRALEAIDGAEGLQKIQAVQGRIIQQALGPQRLKDASGKTVSVFRDVAIAMRRLEWSPASHSTRYIQPDGSSLWSMARTAFLASVATHLKQDARAVSSAWRTIRIALLRDTKFMRQVPEADEGRWVKVGLLAEVDLAEAGVVVGKLAEHWEK